jgi:hypothetical protein
MAVLVGFRTGERVSCGCANGEAKRQGGGGFYLFWDEQQLREWREGEPLLVFCCDSE